MIKSNQNREIIKVLSDKKNQVEDFFDYQFSQFPAPFYCSVDLRYSGFKLSAIDTNLFPAGFNNLHQNSYKLAASEFKNQIHSICPDSKKILIISESNTRNLAYLQNIIAIEKICMLAGFEIEVASFLPERQELITQNGENITLQSLSRNNEWLITDTGFCPCAILLNNDLSSGLPEILQGIEQPIIPSEQMGWQNRLKSVHFEHYQNICELFSKELGIDSWLVNPSFRKCGKIDFMKKSGEDCLAENVAHLFELIDQKYQQYQIKDNPFVVIKDDAGTYGMGIITVSSASEVYELNRKKRKKMNYGKAKNSISKVILQEGVPSNESVFIGGQNIVAEPVIYLVAGKIVGCFYRAHRQKDSQAILNTPGMEFVPINLAKIGDDSTISNQIFYGYSVVSRLATLAASYEIHQINQTEVKKEGRA